VGKERGGKGMGWWMDENPQQLWWIIYNGWKMESNPASLIYK
jgi:hypothetical protein